MSAGALDLYGAGLRTDPYGELARLRDRDRHAETVIGTAVKLEPPQWSHSCTTVLWLPGFSDSLVLRLLAFTTYFRSLST